MLHKHFFSHLIQAFKTVQHQAKHSRKTSLHTHTEEKPPSDGMIRLFEDVGGLGMNQWHESDKRKENKFVWMYCTWEAAPLGWMWLVSCPGLLAPLWVRSFIWRDSRGVWRCCGDWKWKHCSRRLNEHDHPLHIMTAAHTLMFWTAPCVMWGLWEGKQHLAESHFHPSGISQLKQSDQVLGDPGRSLHFVSKTIL